MHILKIGTLVDRLARSEVTEQEKIKYLLGTTILYYCASYFSIYSSSYGGALFYSEFAILILINIAGILYCFHSNGGQKGDRFIENFTCIGFPALVWCYIVFWIPLYIVFFHIKPEWLGLHPENTHHFGAIATYVTVLGFDILFYILIGVNIKKFKLLKAEG